MAEERLIVSSKVKDVLKSEGLMCGADALDAINDCVHCCLREAAERAKANVRKTLQPKDL